MSRLRHNSQDEFGRVRPALMRIIGALPVPFSATACSYTTSEWRRWRANSPLFCASAAFSAMYSITGNIAKINTDSISSGRRSIRPSFA